MNYITQKSERNRRFTRACRDEMARQRLARATSGMIDRVLNSPVERGFFVSVDHVVVMDRRRREGKLPPMSPETRRLWEEIFTCFDNWLALHPRATRTAAAIETVARGRASRFYITPRNARRILSTEKINIAND